MSIMISNQEENLICSCSCTFIQEDTMEQEELHDKENFDIEEGSLPEFFDRLIHKDLGTGRRRSIIKLPPYITRSNPDAYTPEVVSIGPYHHGKEHLKPMEACKRNCVASFMKRSKCNPKRCYDRFREVTPQLMEYYEFLEEKWRQEEDRFLELMVVDGCFLLECFYWRILPYDDPVNDIFRGTMMFNSRRDMILIENQLPLQVLHILLKLYSVEVRLTVFKDLNQLISEFFGQKYITIDYSCLHLLDVLRVSMITRDKGPMAMTTRVNEPIFFYRMFDAGPRFPSATLLSLAGLKFKKGITQRNTRMDISVDEKRGFLWLPWIFVDELTETWFLNLMALERFEVMESNGVSSYISFMGMLVRSAQDVKLLRNHGIIIDGKLAKSDDAIAKLFIELSNNPVNHPDDSLHKERSALEEWSARSRGKLNVRFAKWGSNFVETYCKNPWSAIGLVAGTILLVATVAQTVYTILQFYQRENFPTPSHPLHP
ncbi:hypothetical protein AAC387_Pa10g1345 [Persea americana]